MGAGHLLSFDLTSMLMFKAFPKSDRCFAALLRVLMFAKSLLNLLFFPTSFLHPRRESSGSGVPRLRQPAVACSQAARWAPRWAARGSSRRAPERCERGLGFPALGQGLSRGRCAPRRPLASPCPREQSQERQGAAADSPANFHAEDNQATAPSLPQFRVSSVFAVDCLVEGEAVSPWAGLAIPSDWAHDCGINRDLGAVPNGESSFDNLYAATSMRRPSPAGTSRLRSRRATCDAARAPASLQMRAAARSTGVGSAG